MNQTRRIVVSRTAHLTREPCLFTLCGRLTTGTERAGTRIHCNECENVKAIAVHAGYDGALEFLMLTKENEFGVKANF